MRIEEWFFYRYFSQICIFKRKTTLRIESYYIEDIHFIFGYFSENFGLFRFFSICFGLLRNSSVCFGCFDIGSKNRNKTKLFVFGFTKQTETNAKQILFRFVSVRTEIYFCLFRGHPTYDPPECHPGQLAYTFLIRILSKCLISVSIFSVCCYSRVSISVVRHGCGANSKNRKSLVFHTYCCSMWLEVTNLVDSSSTPVVQLIVPNRSVDHIWSEN